MKLIDVQIDQIQQVCATTGVCGDATVGMVCQTVCNEKCATTTTTTTTTEEPEETEKPVEDKMVVKFEMTFNIAKDDYDTHKDQIKKDIAKLLGTTPDKITVTIVSRRIRRLLTDSVKLEVAVKAADDTTAKAIEDKVKGDTFGEDLAKEIKDSTNLTVEVTGVTAPVSENLNTTPPTSDDDSNNTTMIVIIVVAIVVVLLIAAFVCYTMNNNEKLNKEVGGEAVEFHTTDPGTKRTPEDV